MKNKKIILILVALVSLKAHSQTINFQAINGTLKVCTASNGITYNSNGSVTFSGNISYATPTSQDYSDAGISLASGNNPQLPDIKVSCSSIWGYDGSGNKFRVYNNLCGPLSWNDDGSGNLTGTCANTNAYLCGAAYTDGGPRGYGNKDCN